MDNNQINNSQVESNQVNNTQIENNQVDNNQIPISQPNEQKKNEPVGSSIGTIFLLLIVVGIVTAIFLNKESLLNKKAEEPSTTVKEQKAPEEEKEKNDQEESNNEEISKDEENSDNPSSTNNDKQFLDIEDGSAEATFSVNGKEMTLKEYNQENQYGDYIERLDLNGEIITESEEGFSSISYEVFKSSKDNKEYLFVSVNEWGATDYFINDSGKIIKEIDSDMKVEENCYYTTHEAFEEATTITTIKDGYVYYYIYKGHNGEFDLENIDLYEVKASIGNNQFKDEGETGKKIKGVATNCE